MSFVKIKFQILCANKKSEENSPVAVFLANYFSQPL
jgi:hypothetical protein